MRNATISILGGLAAAVGLAACGGRSGGPATHPAAAASAADPAAGFSGPVLETMEASGYTYVRVETGAGAVWAAGPRVEVAVGDVVIVPPGMEMRRFESKALGRTFEVIYFVGAIRVGGDAGRAGFAHGAPPADGVSGHHGAAAPAVDLSGIARAEGGYTVEDLYQQRAGLAGKEIAVRGRVVKFSPRIMGRNWLHLQDGTGGPGADDLTVTTSSSAGVGDTILVRGKLAVDKDFGAGYRYQVIVEDAEITVE